MLTIGNNANVSYSIFKQDFDSISNLGIDIKNLSLISDSSKTENRINEYARVLKVLSLEEFDSFHTSLTDSQKSSLDSRGSFSILSNPSQNLNIPNQRLQSEICSFLALKHPNSIALIRNPEFKSSLNIENISDILLLQSVLMHNPQGVDEIREISDLTSEQNDKRQQALKKIAIASLTNENLHEKSLDILNGILPQQFDADDKKTIQTSIDFLTASIKSAISSENNKEVISQFNFLSKVLKVYGEKFNTTEHNITLILPENITKTLEEKKKFDESVGTTIRDEETLSPVMFGEISPVAPILNKDNLIEISNQLILTTLKEVDVPENSPIQPERSKSFSSNAQPDYSIQV